MLDGWNWLCQAIFDVLLGWLLLLRGDLALLIVSVATSFLMVIVRLATTDQHRLARAAADTRRLKELLRDAKRRRDKPARARLRRTQSMVAMVKMRAEGKPLLAVILPVALLATWAAFRLEFHAPRAGEPVTVELTTPASAVGEVVHIVPVAGLQAAEGWVRPIELSHDAEDRPQGLARWTLSGPAHKATHTLVFRLRGRTVTRPLLIGQPKYAEAVIDHGGQVFSELRLRPVRLWGLVPQFNVPMLVPWRIVWMPLAPWIVAYLVIAVACVFGFRKLLGIH